MASAVDVVMEIVHELIAATVPGETFEYKDKSDKTIFVSKARLLKTFERIVGQTKGFTLPLKIIFRDGEAHNICWGLYRVLGKKLSNRLYELYEHGDAVPRISFGCDGAGIPFFVLSDVARTRGARTWEHDEVGTLIVQGEIPSDVANVVTLNEFLA